MSVYTSEAAELIGAVGKIESLAINRIATLYGPDGVTPLEYHNVDHTAGVYDAAKRIGNLAIIKGKIDFKEAVLIRVGALGHDLVHGSEESGPDERASAELTTDWMRDFDIFTGQDRDRVGNAIRATTYEIGPDGFRQTAGDDYVEQAVCDADMHSLGLPLQEFLPTAFKYFVEKYGGKIGPNGAFMKYLYGEIAFLNTHSFYTDEAVELFPHKSSNAHAVESILLPTYSVQT